MNCRNSILGHPSGQKIKTPLLIPSYSSKGFAFDKSGKSEICEPMKTCREFLEESLLISAYDLYYDYILNPEDFVSTPIVFIDSGGYEISDSYDFSAVKKYGVEENEWTEELLVETINDWPKQYDSVIVNYDHHKNRVPLVKQITRAKKFFNKFPTTIHDFLIKPPSETRTYIKIDEILKNVHKLHDFDIIGITEKELGNSIFNRMEKIKKIRNELDNVGIKAPIHVFGSLDPVTSTLYFISGAEIFDGLTWIRYSYHKTMAIYPPNFGVFNSDIGIHTHDKKVQMKSLTNNIYYLDKMKYTMLNCIKDGSLSPFQEFGGDEFVDFLNKSYNQIK